MRLRARLVVPALAAASLLGGASGASAATLFTTPAHATRVTVGATASIQSGTWGFTSGTTLINTCSSSTFTLRVTQNTDAVVAATFVSGSWTGCSSFTFTPTFPWTVTTRGNSAISATSTVWTSTTLDGFTYDLLGGRYIGTTTAFASTPHGLTDVDTTFALSDATPGVPPTRGLYWSQPTAAGTPLCLVFAQAGRVVGPLTGDGRIDAIYCFEGGAATWSMTN